jgi:hypothetical protein
VPGEKTFGPQVDGDQGEWAELGLLARSDLDLAWSRLLAITAEVDDAGLYWVGDIIEDLIGHHGWDVAPRLEDELETNERLRFAFLSVVPWHSDGQLQDRLLALRERIEEERQPERPDRLTTLSPAPKRSASS